MNSHNANRQAHPMKYQLNAVAPDSRAGAAAADLASSHQSRCYLCDTPKPEYSLTRSFSEPICRGCLNYEGPDRVEQLLAEARHFKNRQASPILIGGGPAIASAANGLAKSHTALAEQAYKTQAPFAGLKTAPTANLHTISADKQASFLAQDSTHNSASAAEKSRQARRDAQHFGAKTFEDSQTKCDVSRSPSPLNVWDNQQASSRPGARVAAPSHETTQRAPRTDRTHKTFRDKTAPAADCQQRGQTKAPVFADCCKPGIERCPQELGPAPLLNQDQLHNRPYCFEPISPAILVEQQQRLAQHTLRSQNSTVATTAASIINNSLGGQGHNRQADRSVKAKPSATSISAAGLNYMALQHHQQQVLAASAAAASLDSYQMLRTSMPASCNSVADQLLRLHQPQPAYRLDDPSSFARELARFQAGDLLIGEENQSKTFALDGAKTVESLQRLAQEPTSGLAIHATNALSCQTIPYHSSRPPSQAGQQADDGRTHNGSGRAAGAAKQTSISQAAQAQAMSSGLYGHYPIAMGPYLTPGGPLFCATQYHPYHYHPSATFQPQSYGNLLSSTAALVGSGPTAQQAAANGLGLHPEKALYGGLPSANSIHDQNLRRLLTASGPPESTAGKNPLKSAANSPELDRPPSKSLDGKADKTGEHPPNSKTLRIFVDDDLDEPDVVDLKENGSEGKAAINDTEDSCSSNMLIIHDREALDDKSERHRNRRGASNTSPEEPVDATKQRSQLANDARLFGRSPASPPPAKRLAGSFTKSTKSLIGSKSNENCDGQKNSEGVAYRDSFNGTHSSAASAMMASKAKSLSLAIKQAHMTRRSQTTTDCIEIDANKPKSGGALSNGRDADSLLRRENGENGAGRLPKSGLELAPNENHRAAMMKHRLAHSASKSAAPAYQNSDSNDKSYKRFATDAPASASISSTTNGRKTGPVNQQQQQQQMMKQQPPAQLPAALQYTPLKCSTCRERLEDRHFVQCPSVMSHKFCFACSKVAIERQQQENKNLNNGFDRVFCPSGNRCFLATEQTPWTFMNSEIETIFRESSRQTSSASNEANAPNDRTANTNPAGQAGGKSKHQQNGGRDKNGQFEDLQNADSIRREPSLPNGLDSSEKKFDEAPEVNSTAPHQTSKVA